MGVVNPALSVEDVNINTMPNGEEEVVEEVEEETVVPEPAEGEEVDYKALFEAEQEKRKKVSGALKESRRELKDLKKPEKPEEEPKPVADEDAVRRIVREETTKTGFEAMVEKLPADKRTKVRDAYASRIVKTDDIESDFEAALALADVELARASAESKARKRVAEQAELSKGKGNLATINEDDEVVSQEDAAVAASVGMDPKKFKKLDDTLRQMRESK